MKLSTIRLFAVGFLLSFGSKSLKAQSDNTSTTTESSSIDLTDSDILPDSLEFQLESLPNSVQDKLNEILEQFRLAREARLVTQQTETTSTELQQSTGTARVMDLNTQQNVIDAMLDPVVAHDDSTKTSASLI